MYVRHLRVRNLKRCRDLGINFEHAGKPRMWTVLIGENGTAKTTLLQALALTAAGSKQVNTLADGPVVKYLRDRRGNASMSIKVEFAFTPQSLNQGRARYPRLSSEVSLAPNSTTLDAKASYLDDESRPISLQSDPLDEAREFHTPLWFVAGYGISRVLPDPTWTPALARPSIERLQPLFDARATLASTSFANHFLKKDADEGQQRGTTSRLYGSILNKAIKLGGANLLPDIKSLELRGRGGARTAGDLIVSDRLGQAMGSEVVMVPGVALSHGYQSTLAWIADLIGHVILESKTSLQTTKLQTTEMEGLVLLDELDLYLHPTWQATFVTALRRVFPRIQFVATTHSPAVLAGLAPHEVVRLIFDPASGDVVRGAWDPARGELVRTDVDEPPQPDPRSMTGSELYRSWFALDRLTPNPIGECLRQYQVLAADPVPTKTDKETLDSLRRQLKAAGIDLEKPSPPRGPHGAH